MLKRVELVEKAPIFGSDIPIRRNNVFNIRQKDFSFNNLNERNKFICFYSWLKIWYIYSNINSNNDNEDSLLELLLQNYNNQFVIDKYNNLVNHYNRFDIDKYNKEKVIF